MKYALINDNGGVRCWKCDKKGLREKHSRSWRLLVIGFAAHFIEPKLWCFNCKTTQRRPKP